MAKVRVVRLLEYSGERSMVLDHLKKRGVKGSVDLSRYDHNSDVIIREAFLGDPLDIFERIDVSALDSENANG